MDMQIIYVFIEALRFTTYSYRSLLRWKCAHWLMILVVNSVFTEREEEVCSISSARVPSQCICEDTLYIPDEQVSRNLGELKRKLADGM